MNHFLAVFSDTETPCYPLKMLKYLYSSNEPHVTTSHPGQDHIRPELLRGNYSPSAMTLVEDDIQAVGCLQEGIIACITAKANVTQTIVEFTK